MLNIATKARVALLSALGFGATACAQPQITVADVQRAWEAHAAKVTRLQVYWENKRTTYKGSVTDSMGMKAKDGSVLPKADGTHTELCRLWLDGKKARLESDQAAFNTYYEDWRLASHVSVFDEKTALTYDRQSPDPAAKYTAVRRQDGTPPQLKMASLLPVLHWARPTNPAYSTVDFSPYDPTGIPARIRGIACVEFRRVPTKTGATGSIWVDPSRDYLIIRRSVGFAKGNPYSSVQEDIEYSKHESGVWVPSNWTIVTAGLNMPVSSKIDGKLVSVEIGGPIDTMRFDTTPPPQTVLTEGQGKEKTVSIVREKGVEEEVPDGRVSSALEQLAAPPKQRWGWLGRHPILAVALVVAALTLVATLVHRRRVVSRRAV
jgi:hypothetical protein